jgi:hypothetical protein
MSASITRANGKNMAKAALKDDWPRTVAEFKAWHGRQPECLHRRCPDPDDEISAIPDAVVSCAPRRRLVLASSKRLGRISYPLGELAMPRAAATTIAHSELGIQAHQSLRGAHIDNAQ